MPRLQLETATGLLSLDEQVDTGEGVQVHAGVTGLGLPPVSLQWLEGAGDGATYRGRRVLPRDIDIPLTVKASNRAELKTFVRKLTLTLSQPCKLRFIEDDGSSWWTDTHRAGGGEWVYGVDTNGETELATVVTLRAGDPFWTAQDAVQQSVSNTVPADPLLNNFVALQIATSQAIGYINLENPGDVSAYPTWTIQGPGTDFRAVSPSGEVLQWLGTLADGETLTIDTKTASVRDSLDQNRYSEMAAAPRMWQVPPGLSVCEASLQNAGVNSRITCSYRPRRWMVI